MSNNKGSVVIEGLDLLDVIAVIDKKKSKFVALTLQEIETLGLREEEYKRIRKFVLDGFGDFTKSALRFLLCDVEVPPYKGHGG